MQDRILGMLSIAAKGGMIKSGSFATYKAIRSGHAKLVLIAPDASDATKKKIRNMCLYYNTPNEEYGGMGRLGAAIGKNDRAAIAITDAGIAMTVIQKLKARD